MRLVMVCEQRLRICQKLELSGGVTESVLVRSEGWLQKDSDHQKAIDWVGDGRSARKYRSVMDYLLCECFKSFQKDCFEFYAGKGKYLRDLYNKRQIAMIDRSLLQVLKKAYKVYCNRRKLSWGAFLKETNIDIQAHQIA